MASDARTHRECHPSRYTDNTEQFVAAIDDFVNQMQYHVEFKVRMLALAEGPGLLAIIITIAWCTVRFTRQQVVAPSISWSIAHARSSARSSISPAPHCETSWESYRGRCDHGRRAWQTIGSWSKVERKRPSCNRPTTPPPFPIPPPRNCAAPSAAAPRKPLLERAPPTSTHRVHPPHPLRAQCDAGLTSQVARWLGIWTPW